MFIMNTVLVILACLGASGEDCRYFVASDPCTMSYCLSMSQPVAARWAANNPGERIKRIMCTDPHRVEELLGRNKA
jgi:hypothetical protein